MVTFENGISVCPVIVGVVSLVRLSVFDEPESLVDAKSNVTEFVGATLVTICMVGSVVVTVGC